MTKKTNDNRKKYFLVFFSKIKNINNAIEKLINGDLSPVINTIAKLKAKLT